jgi:hypothetical protein
MPANQRWLRSNCRRAGLSVLVTHWTTLFLLVVAAGAASPASYTDPEVPASRLLLSFPELTLNSDAGERVTRISVTVACGRVVGVSRIPADWWLKMEGPISAVTTLTSFAGHGTAYLWHLDTWNRSIAIAKEEPSCFRVSAVVTTEIGGSDKATKHRFSQRQLTLADDS